MNTDAGDFEPGGFERIGTRGWRMRGSARTAIGAALVVLALPACQTGSGPVAFEAVRFRAPFSVSSGLQIAAEANSTASTCRGTQLLATADAYGCATVETLASTAGATCPGGYTTMQTSAAGTTNNLGGFAPTSTVCAREIPERQEVISIFSLGLRPCTTGEFAITGNGRQEQVGSNNSFVTVYDFFFQCSCQVTQFAWVNPQLEPPGGTVSIYCGNRPEARACIGGSLPQCDSLGSSNNCRCF